MLNKSNENQITVACVGAGYFAPFHIEAWHRMTNVELLALCDLDAVKATALAQKYPTTQLFTDVTTMLDTMQPDVLDIITPPATHLALCQKAAERGIHIICQKPLAPTLAEAQQIVALTTKAGVRFMVHENFRFQPWYRKIKVMIAEGRIGDRIHQLYFRMRMGDGWQSDAYLSRQPYFRTMPRLLIYETGIHFIDTFRYLLGEIKSVEAKLRRLNPDIRGEDAALLFFEFKNGAYAVWDANRYNEPNATDARYTFGELVLEGNQGTIRLYANGKITLQRLGEVETVVPYVHERKNFAGDCVFFTQQHFIDCLRKHQPFETNGLAYLKNLEWQEQIYRSSKPSSKANIKDVH